MTPAAGAEEGMLDLFGTTQREQAINELHDRTALYTAEPVVEQVLDMVGWPDSGGRLADSSCGDGAFLAAALKRLMQSCGSVDRETVLARMDGWEIHGQACVEARSRVAKVLTEAGWSQAEAGGTAQALVKEGDFLTEWNGQGRYKAIVGNPPYLRYANLPGVLREEYERAVPKYATADMLHSFIDRCAERLDDGGEIAMVTSDRWLSNDNAAELREVVGRRLGVAHLERLDASSSFYRPKHRKAGTPPRVHPVAVVLKEHAACTRALGKEPTYPGNACDGWANSTLEQVANVRLAPWLGTNGIFLVDELTARRLPKGALVPAMDTEDVRNGVLGKLNRYAILTRPDEEPDEAIARHLDSVMHKMCERGRKAARWMPPERFDHLDLSSEQLVVPRIAKTLRPIRVPAGVLPVNHNLSIVRRGERSLEEIEAMLNDRRGQEWIQERANRLENGYLSITTGLLRRLPVEEAA